MLKKMFRTIIIALIQVSIIGALVVWLTPALVDSASFQASLKHLFHSSKYYTLALRLFFYVVVFYFWPVLMSFFLKTHKNASDEQKQSLYKAKWPLIGSLLLLEILYWVR